MKLGINPAWLLAQIINFVLLIFILRAVAYKPIMNMLETRKQKVQESLEYAERVKRDAAEQQKEFDRKLEDARRDAQNAVAAAAQVGEKEREVILSQAREEASKIVAQAKEQIEFERKQLTADVREQVVSLSLLAAQRVVSTSLDERTHRRLVDEFLAQADKLAEN